MSRDDGKAAYERLRAAHLGAVRASLEDHVARLDWPPERIERYREVSFSFDGKQVVGLEGDTIGSALFAGGQRTFSRSFKYHRRRGLFCCAGQCPNRFQLDLAGASNATLALQLHEG